MSTWCHHFNIFLQILHGDSRHQLYYALNVCEDGPGSLMNSTKYQLERTWRLSGNDPRVPILLNFKHLAADDHEITIYSK